MHRLRSQTGQLMMPLVVLFLFMALATAALIREGRAHVYQMRLDLAADAVALSGARAEAEMLSGLCVANAAGNLFYLKEKFPGVDDNMAVMLVQQVVPFTVWKRGLGYLEKGFLSFSMGTALSVAKANQVTAAPLLPVASQLLPQAINAAIIVSFVPPVVTYRHYDGAYLARGWSPSHLKAQPPHKTVWRVSNKYGSSVGSARLWLDVTSGNSLHNGGFPRVHENMLHGLDVQAFFPQFNARLLPRPSWATALQLLGANGKST
jgi:hypothetical protein